MKKRPEADRSDSEIEGDDTPQPSQHVSSSWNQPDQAPKISEEERALRQTPSSSSSSAIRLGGPPRYAEVNRHVDQVPILVYIYAQVARVLSVLGGIVFVAAIFYMGLMEGNIGSSVVYFPAFSMFLLMLFICYRLASALREGERSAVYGLCIFAVLFMLFAVLSKEVFWAIAAAICFPPIISAFQHWKAFI